MVTRAIQLVLCVGLVAACSFKEREFGDRFCAADQDCPRPDQTCVLNACTQKSCEAKPECGATFEFGCEAGGCVAKACSGTNDCSIGFACEEGFCAASFNVVSATSASHTTLAVTFDAPPDETSATTRANYTVSGLTLSGTPTVSGNTVTLTTSPQTESSYTVTVEGVTRGDDGAPLKEATAMFTGRSAFDVTSAVSASNTTILVTFSAPPSEATATTLANYSVPGLTLTNTPIISGNTITLSTSPQAETSYTVTVSNVRRASDSEPLTIGAANFTGRTDFNVAIARSLNSRQIEVEFDAPPNAAAAMTLANYSVTGLTLSGVPALAGNKVTISTSPQAAQSYTVVVANVTRETDSEPLNVAQRSFAGILPFKVVGAVSTSSTTLTVTFDAAPDPIAATTAGNYSISGLTIGGMPMLSGNVVTLSTSPQSATSYTLMVSDVARDSDGEPLLEPSATFVGRAPFNVATAQALSSRLVRITFDAPPDPTAAMMLTSYSIPGLTLSGTPSVSGNDVTLTTSPQSATAFTVTVSGVKRDSDDEALTTTDAMFLGRAPFNIVSAIPTSSTTLVVTFDAAPNAGQANTLANYAIAGLTPTGVSASGLTATLTTPPQEATSYTLVVSNVTRNSDSEELTVSSKAFMGRPPFKVTGASSVNNVAMTVMFDAPPNMTEAMDLDNYSVSGLALSGTPTVSGNTVTIETASQIATDYNVTVSNVTRASDGELMSANTATFTGKVGFNVSSATSVNNTTMSVTFDAPPNAVEATKLSNYSVGGLSLTGTPTLSGSTVTITTAPQSAQQYTVTVSASVTRASDNSPLQVNTANFTHVSFNVLSAVALSNTSVLVTFDAAPNPTQANVAANYSITGMQAPTVTAAVTTDTSVTLTTTSQNGASYNLTVSTNVTRASDATTLTQRTVSFDGRARFDVIAATAVNNGTLKVTFSHPPNPTQATTLANYNVPNLQLNGTPLLSGNDVTISTESQVANMPYSVTVSNVTRQADGEELTTANRNFTGAAVKIPTVTNVTVVTTSPNNGAIPYNTGSTTILITGTEFTDVSCPTGVTLADLNGMNVAVNTQATSCTVNGYTQITAIFPSGIRTNGAIGWDVRVQNSAGTSTNTAQAGKFVPKAGLLVSEVYTGNSGGENEHEFIEIFNPTAHPISLTGLGVSVHVMNGTNDTTLAITYQNPAGSHSTIASRGFLLLSSSQSDSGDAWFATRDGTFSAASNATSMGPSSGVYLSMSTSPQGKVIDKVGWGTSSSPPPTFSFEGAFVNGLNNNSSTQRRPGGGQGAATDSDTNSTDFNAPSQTISPKGTADPIEP